MRTCVIEEKFFVDAYRSPLDFKLCCGNSSSMRDDVLDYLPAHHTIQIHASSLNE